jgi:hypothetical protein
VTGADTGAVGTAHFEPGGVAFWSKAKKTRRGISAGLKSPGRETQIDSGPRDKRRSKPIPFTWRHNGKKAFVRLTPGWRRAARLNVATL